MAISKETTFTDGVTVVTAEWLNLIQEHLAGFVNLLVENPSSTQVRITASADNGVASVYINGQQRRRETNLSFTFSAEAANTYNVYVTADSADDLFGLEVKTGAAVATNNRKVAEVDWNGSAITAIRMVRGRREAHSHTALDGSGQVDHGNLSNLSADSHTQYIRADGARAFTNPVAGVTPSGANDLATKGYVDGLSSSGVAPGIIVPFAGAAAPSGWLLCQGQTVAQATYPGLFSAIGHSFAPDPGGGNFILPDPRGYFLMGVAVAGTGSTLGAKGGSLDHTHTQPTHSHTVGTHTHTTPAHSHSVPTTSLDGDHAHTQGSTGSTGSHTHSGPSHTHSSGSLVTGDTGGAKDYTRHASAGTPGLFQYNDLNEGASSTSHAHGAGSYETVSGVDVAGTSSSASASHTHSPAAHAYDHQHGPAGIAGSVAASGTGATSSNGDHSHSNPTTSTTGDHQHTFSASTGTAAPSTNSGGSGSTSSDGNQATGTANPPFLAVNFIIKT